MTPEAVVVEHRGELAGYQGILCVIRNERVLVSAPPRLVPTVRSWRPTISAAGDALWWNERRPDWSVLGPSVHAFTDRPAPPPPATEGAEVRPATPADLVSLRDAVAPAEWAESGFAGDDVASAWVAVDRAGRVLAAANLTPFDGLPADVGILSAPAVRGRGIATLVAAVATNDAFERHGIARWRALCVNTPSRRLAHRLGFEDDCVQLALRPA
jgi:hypothetical protein